MIVVRRMSRTWSACQRRAFHVALDGATQRLQHLEDEELIAFSRLYGALEAEPDIGPKAGTGGRSRRIAYREIFDISNLDENGSIVGESEARSSLLQITQLWHTDLSFRQGPAKWSMLNAKVIPPAGGDTEYADTRAALRCFAGRDEEEA
jgi:alpha-ketoglutarate-dependent 2,4-dichlorophenoxyacetate dioxygenase